LLRGQSMIFMLCHYAHSLLASCCCWWCASHAAASRPLCRSSASVLGCRPLNSSNTCSGALLPPSASTVSLQQQQQCCTKGKEVASSKHWTCTGHAGPSGFCAFSGVLVAAPA
jgi:hypothetical protein